MALHTALPIYRDARDLFRIGVEYASRLPRAHKPMVGHRIADLCADLGDLIFEANCADDPGKIVALTQLQRRIAKLNLYLRYCHEEKFISDGQYGRAIQLTTSLSKQATGWKKHHAASPVT